MNNYNYRIGTSYMLFEEETRILFVDLFGCNDGVYLATSVGNSNIAINKISDKKEVSKVTKKKVISELAPSYLSSVLSQNNKVEVSESECEEIIQSLLENV